MSETFPCSTVCCSVYGGSMRHKINLKSPLSVSEDSCRNFLDCGWFWISFFVGEWVWWHMIDCCLLSGVWWNTHVSSPITMESRNFTLSYEWHMRNISTTSIWVFLWFAINIFGTHHTHSLWYSTLSITMSLTNNLDTSQISCSALLVTSLLARMLSSLFIAIIICHRWLTSPMFITNQH